MNKLINVSNKEEETKKNMSADFYILTLFSKDILNLDNLRIKDYKEFYNTDKNSDNNFKNKKKYLFKIFVSGGLIYFYKSFLVVPLFFGNCYILNILKNKIFKKNSDVNRNIQESCYFCQRKLNKENLTEKYTKYYILIKYILDKNAKINNISDFEKELDNIIKFNNINTRL